MKRTFWIVQNQKFRLTVKLLYKFYKIAGFEAENLIKNMKKIFKYLQENFDIAT